MDGHHSPRSRHHSPPEPDGSFSYDIESMDGSAGGAWRGVAAGRNGSSEALLRYDDDPRKRTMNTTSQIAIVGANVCPIESLDYDDLDS